MLVSRQSEQSFGFGKFATNLFCSGFSLLVSCTTWQFLGLSLNLPPNSVYISEISRPGCEHLEWQHQLRVYFLPLLSIQARHPLPLVQSVGDIILV